MNAEIFNSNLLFFPPTRFAKTKSKYMLLWCLGTKRLYFNWLQTRTHFRLTRYDSGILVLVLLLSFVLLVAFGKVLPGLNPFITLAFQLFSAVAQVTGNLISAITQVTGYLMRCLQVTAITQIFYAHGGSCQCHRVPM